MEDHFCISLIDLLFKLSVDQLFRLLENFRIYFFGQIERHHGDPGIQSLLDLLEGFEVISVRSEAFLKILLKDRPGSILDHLSKISSCLCILTDGLLGQDRMDLEFFDSPDVSGSG